MEIDIDALEIAAHAATPGPWVAERNDNPTEFWFASGYLDVGPAIIGVEYGKLGAPELANAAYIAAANPAVVLELVERLKAAESKLAALRPLTIGNVDGDATLYGTAEEVRAFHMKLRTIDENNRIATIDEEEEAIKLKLISLGWKSPEQHLVIATGVASAVMNAMHKQLHKKYGLKDDVTDFDDAHYAMCKYLGFEPAPKCGDHK
ncbi:ead/Ea22-like family protein [Bradyrhizobium sp. RDT10]